MVDKLKDYSTTAASNNSAAPDGWPEGMAPSDVNNCAREMMARLREWYADAQWINLGQVPSAYTGTTITLSGDVTGDYIAGRKIRLDENNSRVAKVESSSYSAPNTTVTVSGYTIAALPTSVELHIVSSEDYLPIIPPTVPEGYLTGCEISNNSTDSAHDIDVAAGQAKDSTGVYTFDVSAITKRIDANWASGTGNGGFPTGITLSADTWYRVFLIGKTDGTVDAGFDTDASATNLLADATGYTLYRRIGWVLTDSSSNIKGFEQDGDEFFWTDITVDSWTLNDVAQQDTTITAPPSTTARLVVNASYSGTVRRFVTAKATAWTDTAPSASSHTMVIEDGDGNTMHILPVDSSSQISLRVDDTGSMVAHGITVLGWKDKRAA